MTSLVYRQFYFSDMGFSDGYCPEAEKNYIEEISLPIFPTLRAEQMRYIIEIPQEAIGK